MTTFFINLLLLGLILLMSATIIGLGLKGRKSYVFFIIVDLALFAYSGYLFYGTYSFVRQTILTDGEIVSFSQTSYSGVSNRRTGTKTVSYNTQVANLKYLQKEKGKEISTSLPWQDGSEVGQKIPIRYDPQNPSHVESNSFWSLWGNDILMLLTAMIFLVCRITFENRKKLHLAVEK